MDAENRVNHDDDQKTIARTTPANMNAGSPTSTLAPPLVKGCGRTQGVEVGMEGEHETKDEGTESR